MCVWDKTAIRKQFQKSLPEQNKETGLSKKIDAIKFIIRHDTDKAFWWCFYTNTCFYLFVWCKLECCP